MRIQSESPMPKSHAIAFFVVFVAVGWIANHLPLEVFFSIQFLFGSVFSMLALQALGLWWGVTAGLLIASCTWITWNHPWGIVTLTSEVLTVGLLCQRRRDMGLVLADAIFWLVLGIPMVFVLYAGVMDLAWENATVVAFKQAINGIGNALGGRLLFMWACRYLGGQRPHALREMVFNLLIFFCLTPAIVFLTIQSRAEVGDMEGAVRGAISIAGHRVARNLDNWLDSNLSQLSYLAQVAARVPAAAMQEPLALSLSANTYFLRIGLIDASGISVAFAPPADELGKSTIGKDFSDRPFIPVLKEKMQPLLSEVVMGRIGRPKPAALIAVPVVKEGRYDGYIAGVLDLERIGDRLAADATAQMLPGVIFTLTDKNQRIIATNREGGQLMEEFSRGEGDLIPSEGGLAKWLPKIPKNISISDRWRHGFYVTEERIGKLSEWTITLDQPIAPFQTKLYAKYTGHLGRLFAALFLALAFAHLLSRQLTATLTVLAGITRDLPAKLATDEPITWPEQTMVKEAGNLIENFRIMAATLTRQFRDIHDLNASLERRIDERTAELQASREQYRLLAENISDVAWRIELPSMRLAYISPSVMRLRGFTQEEAMALPFERHLTPTSLQDVQGWLAQEMQSFSQGKSNGSSITREVELRCKDGGTVWTEVVSSFLPDSRGQPAAIVGIARDISIRKRMEERLRESESRFRSLFENVHVVSLLIDPADGGIVDANTEAARFYGWSRASLRGMNITDINTLPAAEVKTELERARRDESCHCLFRHRLADGSERDVEVYSGPVRAEGRELLYSIVHDVTSRLQAEKALQEKTAELDRFFTYNLDLLCTADTDGYFRRLNPEWERCLGYPLKVLEGARFLDFVHPDDLEATLQAMQTLSGQKPVIGLVNRYRTADGSYRLLEWRSYPIDRLVYAAARDITERRAAEIRIEQMAAEQRTILDTLTVGVIFVRGRRILWANAAMSVLFGYSPEELLGMETSPLYVDEAAYRHIGEDGYQVINAGRIYTVAIPMRHKDGHAFWVSVTGRAVDPGEPAARSIWMIQDISERKKAERLLIEKSEALETLTRDLEGKVRQEVSARQKNEQILVQQSKLAAMGEMIGAIAHQWRQPLNTLGLCVQNLRDAWLRQELDQDYLEKTTETALAQVRHMSRTIDDFRNFFLPDKQRTVFDTMAAAGEVLALFSAQLQAHGIGWEFVCCTHGQRCTTLTNIVGCPTKSVCGYRNEFEHVLLNLINNAKDAILDREKAGGFSPGQAGRIVLEFSEVEEAVVIRVVDNGGGVPAAIRERIFEPYFTTKDPGHGGTGIGLYMSKIIIEDHMDGILITEDVPDGAAFTITLPAARMPAAGEA